MITVNLGGKELDLEFNINVVEVLQEQLDIPFSKIFKKLGNERTAFTALKSLITAMANEAIEIHNDNNGTHNPLYRTRQIGALMDYDTIWDLSNQLTQYVADRMPEAKENTPR